MSTAIEAYNIGKEIVNIKTCPIGGPIQSKRHSKACRKYESLPKKYAKIVSQYIERKLDEYHSPNENGICAYDMDQAMLYGI